MSIIHDALKKAQKGLDAQTPSPKHPDPVKQNKLKSFLALICAMAIIAGSSFYIWKLLEDNVPRLKHLTQKSFLKFVPHPFQDTTAKPTENLKPLGTISSPKVQLNIQGIMARGNSNVVLINDQVYQEGDQVQGVKIVKVDLNSIEVINNGSPETIAVKG